MRILALLLALTLTPLPLLAQEAKPKGEASEGLDLMGKGAQLLLRGIMSEMEPRMSELGTALSQLQPILRDLAGMIGDIRNYHRPEMLPNGDIILRRRTPLDPPAPDAEIDL